MHHLQFSLTIALISSVWSCDKLVFWSSEFWLFMWMFDFEQGMLSHETAVIAETEESWFNCQKLRLSDDCGYEFQMQYGSIGWSVGDTL